MRNERSDTASNGGTARARPGLVRGGKADAELNAIWPQVLASVDQADYLTPEQRAAWKAELHDAQRAWVQYKEHDCNGAVLYEWWGGSGAGGAISSCLLAHTKARTDDLKSRYLSER